jgi:hypothetical protein
MDICSQKCFIKVYNEKLVVEINEIPRGNPPGTI